MASDLDNTIDLWIASLARYDFEQICARPSPGSWSLGQVCMHLLADTGFYIDQIKTCIVTNDHTTEQPSANGKAMLLKDDFPDEVIEGDPSNAFVPQPESKQRLIDQLKTLKKEMHEMKLAIAASPFKGKTRHPGLGYFSATEWFQFTGMHFRHHLRQKKRIDDFLKDL